MYCDPDAVIRKRIYAQVLLISYCFITKSELNSKYFP